jgi:hypothetical protein
MYFNIMIGAKFWVLKKLSTPGRYSFAPRDYVIPLLFKISKSRPRWPLRIMLSIFGSMWLTMAHISPEERAIHTPLYNASSFLVGVKTRLGIFVEQGKCVFDFLLKSQIHAQFMPNSPLDHCSDSTMDQTSTSQYLGLVLHSTSQYFRLVL